MSENSILLKENLQMEVEKDSGILHLTVKGNIDTYNSLNFQQEVFKLIEGGNKLILCNCSGLTYVSSTGIGVFSNLLKILREREGNLVLSNLQPRVYDVFSLLGFHKIFNIVDDSLKGIALLNIKSSSLKKPFVSSFPKKFFCPGCAKKLEATKSGKFRCPSCKSVLFVDMKGCVFFE